MMKKLFENTFLYNNSFINRSLNTFLDFYIGHHKVVGKYKGKLVFSSFLNPFLSDASADLLANRFISNLMQKPRPGIMHFSITDKCQANCSRCSFYGAIDKNKSLLNTKQAIKIILESQELGVSVINFVGGEPLLRNDISELVKVASNKKSTCSIYTNGILLKKKAKSLKDSGLLFALVSLDSYDPIEHDNMRNYKGAFKSALEGIKEAQKCGLLTGISTVMKSDDLYNDRLDKMMILAKKLKVNEVIVFGSAPVGRNKKNIPKKLNFKDLLNFMNKYSRKKDFPGLVFYPYIKHPSRFGCTGGRNFFYISPYGEMHPCDFCSRSYGNALNNLNSAWQNLSSDREKKDYMNEFCLNYE